MTKLEWQKHARQPLRLSGFPHLDLIFVILSNAAHAPAQSSIDKLT